MGDNQKPAFTLRDGLIKVTAWEKTGDNGTFYNIDLTRSYKDSGGDWKESTSFTGGDVLRASNLLQQAYNKTLELKANANG